jgi:HEAT repeat protein
MRKITPLFLVAGVTLGCGPSQPTLSGGKPVEHWVRALRDPDARVRKEAASKLGNAGPMDASIVPELIVALKDSDAKVRCEVILALVKFGSDAKDAVPTLIDLRDADRDSRVRSYAAEAIEKIQKGK